MWGENRTSICKGGGDLTFIIDTFGCWVQRYIRSLFALSSRSTGCFASHIHRWWQRRSRRRSKNGPLPRFWWPWFSFKLFLRFAGDDMFLFFLLLNVAYFLYVPINPPWHEEVYTENLSWISWPFLAPQKNIVQGSSGMFSYPLAHSPLAVDPKPLGAANLPALGWLWASRLG